MNKKELNKIEEKVLKMKDCPTKHNILKDLEDKKKKTIQK